MILGDIFQKKKKKYFIYNLNYLLNLLLLNS
jgi:hypothetical protein